MRLRGFATAGCFALSGAFVVMHASCTSSNATPAPVDASAAVLTIGVSNSLTGGLAGIGAPLHKAWTVAQTYLNANGGILGKNVSFVELDDATDDGTQSTGGATVTGVAQRLIALGPAAVIGPNGSAQVDTVWQLFQASRIPQISGTATSVEFETLPDDAGPDARYFFRTVPADDAQGKALALLAKLGAAGAGGTLPDGGPASGGDDAGTSNACPTIALLYYSNAYGIPMSKVFKANVAPGTTIVTEQQITEGQVSFKDQIDAISGGVGGTPPACLAMILYDTDGDAFLQAYEAANGSFPGFVMGTDGVYDSTFLSTGLPTTSSPPESTIVEGVYGTNPDSNPTDPVNAPNYQFFKNLYVDAFPLAPGETDVEAFASNEFDAAMLLALSIEKAGTATDGQAIRNALLDITSGKGKVHGPGDLTGALEDIQHGSAITYTGASGPCRLDPNTGNTSAGYIIWQVQNGNFVTLQHIPAAAVQ